MEWDKACVSVIIPVYNGAAFVTRAIESVLNQDYDAIECVVVDDGSTDNTKDIVSTFDDRIVYVYQPNSGLPSARNCGIRNSTGRYIALLDCDDRFKPGKISRQIEVLEQNREVVLVHGNAEVVDDKDELIPGSPWEKKKGWRPPYTDATKSLFSGNFVIAGTAVFRRAALECAGLFDETLDCCEDYEYWLRLSLCGKFEYVGKKLLTYVWHGNNMSADRRKMAKGKLEARERFLRCRPKAVELLGEEWCNDIVCRRARELGYSLWASGDGASARQIYKYGSAIVGRSPELHRFWLKSFVPKQLKNILKRA